jgi:hypothetical protein
MYIIYIYADDYIMYIYIYVFTIVDLVDSFFLLNGTRYRHMTTNVYIHIYIYMSTCICVLPSSDIQVEPTFGTSLGINVYS